MWVVASRAAPLAALAVMLGACVPSGAAGGSDASRGNASCGPATATVARVIDGDTIVLASGERVRYLMLDAPETTLGHDDCYGSNATVFNTDLVAGKDVELRYDVQCEDAYGRLLAYITVGGIEINPLLVERGYACMLHIPPNGNDRVSEFEDLQAIARQDRRGVWTCNPLPPACR